ncbi:hypothetical protein [Streptomyces sp. NPDC057702]|uniref:hypothetical protein n=1 Tax=unclassified Streptomyces TaxID=2593676 RepID=UPI0036AAA5FC
MSGAYLRYVLTGHHEVRTASGAVLRFFLADVDLSDPACVWRPALDWDFQHAYENSLFDREAMERGDLRANSRHVQVALDALAGPGGYFWSDGEAHSGVMTTNGQTPDACGLGLRRLWDDHGGPA